MKFKSTSVVIIIFLSLAACQSSSNEGQSGFDYYNSDFFKTVQLSGIFPDAKTFADCTPKRSLREITEMYKEAKDENGFQLREFVLDHFELPVVPVTGYKTDTAKSVQQHITELWPLLTRQPDEYNPLSSLIPLPKPYIVPGGRFGEIYYWDTYFTMLGLINAEEADLTVNMVDNFSFLIDSLGFIPNGNRNYYLGRSQPPFFSLMVDLVASENRDLYNRYLKAMVKEYDFWMNGSDMLNIDQQAHKRVVLMPDGSVLNRYWDNYETPRPESYRHDYQLIHDKNLEPSLSYRHLRAGAESGWDFSSRWLADHENLQTIHTTDIIPVDLNALLYHLELKIAQGYNWSDDLKNATLFLGKAENRKDAINKYLWDENDQFYVDFDYKAQKPTGVLSLAGAYPLFFKLSPKIRAKPVVERLLADFLKPGGFVTTLNQTGQQWDSPNGWSPLQWITINALYNFGYYDEGNEAAERWLQRNRSVFKATGKMMEKYNVIDTMLLAGGGEYPLQDGFGWTNGVAVALQKILADKAVVEEMAE
ncbi:MAG: alpha,alpha-trehalase TreF [Fulvivirga sp.]